LLARLCTRRGLRTNWLKVGIGVLETFLTAPSNAQISLSASDLQLTFGSQPSYDRKLESSSAIAT